MKRFFSRVILGTMLCLGLCAALPHAAQAHSEQTEAAQVEISARRDYLSLRVVGAGVDLRDAIAQSEGHDGHKSPQPNSPAMLGRLAAHYVESHLFFEQNEQILPLKAGTVRFWQLRTSDIDSEQFEIFVRAERPFKLARTPLRVSSTLFGNLEKAATIVYMGGETHVVRGVKVVEFPLSATVPTLQGDLSYFAWSGFWHPFSGAEHLLFLTALFLAASLVPLRRLLAALAGFTLAHGVAFSLALTSRLALPESFATVGTMASIIAVASLAWWQAREAERGTASATGSVILVVLATVGGLLHGFSGAAPLQVWGLPESGLNLCILAWTLGVCASQILMTLVVWPVLSHLRQKFAHNAQYGGMTWSRALQIASIACIAGGGLWFAQSEGTNAPVVVPPSQDAKP